MLDKNISVRRAAKMFDVLVMTLRDRDRVTGKTATETTKSGPDSMFAREEELTLVEHLEAMAQLENGYTYTHAQLKCMVADLVVALGKRQATPQMKNINWFLGRRKSGKAG